MFIGLPDRQLISKKKYIYYQVKASNVVYGKVGSNVEIILATLNSGLVQNKYKDECSVHPVPIDKHIHS